MQHVAVLHFVFLAFRARLAGVFRTDEGDVIISQTAFPNECSRLRCLNGERFAFASVEIRPQRFLKRDTELADYLKYTQK